MIRTLQGLRGRKRAVSALCFGALAALAMPPLNLWPLMVAGVTLFLTMADGPEPWRVRTGFSLGWTFGLGYFLVSFHWIGFAFLVDAKTYLWMMPFAVGGLSAAMALYWGFAGATLAWTRWRGLPLVLGFAAFVASAEWLRGRLFTGFPWAAPGLAVDGMGPLAQSASLVGMTGLTFLVLLWAGLPLMFFRKQTYAERLIALGIAAFIPLLFGFGGWRLNGNAEAVVPDVALRIVQPNIGQDEKWREENARPIFDKYLSLSSAASADHPNGIGAVTHVIWPESAVPFLIDESAVAKEELSRILAGHTVLITGALRRDLGRLDADGEPAVFNSVITFDGGANVVARYDKWRLVPGGEFLPFEWLLKPLGFRKVVTVPGSFESGPGAVSIAVPGAPKAGMLVCYEAIFPHGLVDAGDRPGWLVNVTNDGWFGASTGPYQHLAQARLRAIEQGLPVVRAANTGISAVIDSYGNVLKSLGLGQTGIIDSPLPESLPLTPYGRLGDMALAALAAAAILLAIALAHRQVRRK